MIRRARRPSFSHDELPMLLDALRDARMWTLKYEHSHDFHSDMRPICEAVTKSIDRLGEELTGDPEYFWRKMATGN
ncbi:MAG: hypothetical protein ACOZAM_15840 [Pseudomonadota bacterium]